MRVGSGRGRPLREGTAWPTPPRPAARNGARTGTAADHPTPGNRVQRFRFCRFERRGPRSLLDVPRAMRDDLGVIAAGLSCSDSSPPGAAGPPLVLVHGAGGTHEHWPSEVRTLPGRRVLALDLPGHGSAPGPALTSIGAYARAVVGLLDALGVPVAVLAGHSMGGAVALTAALDAPSRVAGLALLGTGARLRVSPAVLQATADPAALAAGAATMADFSFGTLAGDELRRVFVADVLACPPGVAHGDFVACDVFDVMARLGEIRAPTLVVCGSEDRLTPPKYSQFLRDHIAGARLELVPGAGHMVMLEAPGRVAAALEGFLASLAPPR